MRRFTRNFVRCLFLLILIAVWIKLLLTPLWTNSSRFIFETHYEPITYWERGWPIVFQQDDRFPDPRKPGAIARVTQFNVENFSPWLLALDLAIGIAIFTLVGYWLFGRENLLPRRYSLRALMIATLLVAAICGWWFGQYLPWRREQAAIATLQSVGATLERTRVDYAGPGWLARLCSPWLLSPDGNFRTAGPVMTRSSLRGSTVQTAWVPSRNALASWERVITVGSPSTPLRHEQMLIFAAALPDFTCLRELTFAPRVATIDSAILEPVARCRCLEYLRLAGTDVDQLALAAIEHLPKLRILDLSVAPNIDDQAVDHLCKFRALETLFLRGTLITDQGARRLIELPNLKRISLPFRISDEVANLFSAKGITVE